MATNAYFIRRGQNNTCWWKIIRVYDLNVKIGFQIIIII